MPLANGAFFGAAIDNIRVLPDPLFLSLGFYNQTRAFTDAQYIVQTDINSFDWTNFDATTAFCASNKLIRSWYGGYIGGDTEQWLTNFPSWSGSDIVTATTNFLVAAAARNPNFTYINFCNEGLLHSDNTLQNPNRFLNAFGGAGSTGYDWIINLSQLFRSYFPNAKLGLNDFEWEAANFGSCYGNPAYPSLLPQLVAALKILLANGAQIDWMGAEGYDPECNAIADILSSISQVAALGLKIIFTEFTPNSTPPILDQSAQLKNWQQVLQLLANSPYVIGVTGPIDYRKSDANTDQIGGYIVDDTLTPPALTLTATWLKTYLLPPPSSVSISPGLAGISRQVYPAMPVAGEISYKIGSFSQLVPPFLPDTVMIRPYGEYGILWNLGIYTKLNGGYWLNVNSSLFDPSSSYMSDLNYLVKNDLAILPTVKKIIIAVHWYSSLDQGNVAVNQIVPAIGPEVQAWNWVSSNAPPAEYLVATWTRANAYRLKATHQVWPTLDDHALISGIKYLQSIGYEVGLCPIASLVSNNYFYAGGGEWEVDRSKKNWTDPIAFTNYLTAYQKFYNHYIDLCVKNQVRPWILYLGYAMRDITCGPSRTFLRQFVTLVQTIATYAKSQLPNTLLTYAADLDEYYYSYLVKQNNCYLDPLWTIPELDFVGINWFAPLAINDTEDNNALTAGVTQGEADTYSLAAFTWRADLTDRLISNTTRNFKTGLKQTSINRLTNGIKDIVDWLSFFHYYPAVSGALAGCSPLPGIFPGDDRLCAHIHGTGPVGGLTVINPTVGGIAPIPDLKATWLQIMRYSYAYLNFPVSIPDSSTLDFQFNFAIDPALTNLSGTYRLLDTGFGLKVDSIAGTITLWLLHIDGSYQQVPLFSAASGSIELVYTPQMVKILVDGAYDFTVYALGQSTFRMPAPMDILWVGNPAQSSQIPSGYGIWQGKIYFLSMILGALLAGQSGGQYYFDDSYNGIRTAWNPGMKPWMATSFGYGSIHGSGADPQTRSETILYSGATGVPNWYSDYINLTAAIFRNGFKVWNIRGPYGSTFDPDQVYQAIVLNAAALGLIDAGARHQVAWFFDTRSGGAYLAKMANGIQIFNDAYDFEINSVLNSKAAVRDSGTKTLYPEYLASVDAMLGLAIDPEFLPPQRALLVQPGVPQV